MTLYSSLFRCLSFRGMPTTLFVLVSAVLFAGIATNAIGLFY